MGDLQFRLLPVDADQGLPQSFTFSIASASYTVFLYASIAVRDSDPLEQLYDLSSPSGHPNPQSPPGYLVIRIDRRTPGGAETLLLRKLVPEPAVVHTARELAVVLRQAVIARGNLNGRGRFGSKIVIGIAPRWV